MHNKKYYLVSPRVDGVTIQGFIETMFEQHIVMMGWGTDNKIGADFNNLKKGDFVIVAQRVNCCTQSKIDILRSYLITVCSLIFHSAKVTKM